MLTSGCQSETATLKLLIKTFYAEVAKPQINSAGAEGSTACDSKDSNSKTTSPTQMVINGVAITMKPVAAKPVATTDADGNTTVPSTEDKPKPLLKMGGFGGPKSL